MSTVNYKNVTLSNGVDLFFLEAGKRSNPTLLLLHGFPTSSRQFQKLIPLLAPHFHLLAPDLPGYGLTKVTDNDYKYTFENLAITIDLFLKKEKVEKFSLYGFDYGAPTAYRLALKQKHPKNITAIISQNGNAYEEGMGREFWAPIRVLWGLEELRAKNGKLSKEDEDKFNDIATKAGGEVLSLKGFQGQYFHGEPEKDRVNGEFPLVDYLTAESLKDNQKIQLDYFLNYGSNLKLYPQFQQFFRETNVPILAVWGKNDLIFVEEGADAYKKDSKDVKVVKLDAGHFVSLSHAVELADEIIDFFKARKIIT